uniref:Uncharacterized protein n=1 Tax=Setaria italica TaxID=4555 RepID=K3Y3R8_SETIT
MSKQEVVTAKQLLSRRFTGFGLDRCGCAAAHQPARPPPRRSRRRLERRCGPSPRWCPASPRPAAPAPRGCRQPTPHRAPARRSPRRAPRRAGTGACGPGPPRRRSPR